MEGILKWLKQEEGKYQSPPVVPRLSFKEDAQGRGCGSFLFVCFALFICGVVIHSGSVTAYG